MNDTSTPAPDAAPRAVAVQLPADGPLGMLDHDRGHAVALHLQLRQHVGAEACGVQRNDVRGLRRGDSDGADLRQVAECQHRSIGLVDDLHPLDGLRLVTNRNGFINHLHEHVVHLSIVRQASELNSQSIGVQQYARLKWIQHEAKRRWPVMSRARPV